MSVKVSSWVWHGDETADLSGNEMILLLALADVAADDGRCVYLTDDDELTYAGLARKARIDRRTVIRLVAKLRGRGLLEQTKGTRGQQNTFVISVPWRRSDKLSPVDSVTSETDSVTTETAFGDNADHHSSYRRTDVTDVSLSPDESDDATLIPDDWRPNQSHIDKAASLNLDVRREYQRFREHAERTRRRLKSWNAGFTNWLRKGAEMAQQRATTSTAPRTFAQQRQDSTLALVARYQEEERHAEIGNGDAAGVRAIAAGA